VCPADDDMSAAQQLHVRVGLGTTMTCHLGSESTLSYDGSIPAPFHPDGIS